MKLRLFFFVLSLLILGLAPASYAQFVGDSFSAITYNMALPVADTKDFTSTYSWRGLGMEFRKFTKENMSIGISLGWNVLHEEVTGTVSIADGQGSATGNQDRTINAFPLMVGFQYYFSQKGARPYLGLSGPGYYVSQRLDIGVFSFEDDGWNWGLAPEIGVLVPLQSEASLLINARYNYAFEGYGRGPFSYLGINVGFGWLSF